MSLTEAPAIAPLLHSIPTAAKMLGVGRSTVYELMSENKLRSVHLGRRRMIPDSALRLFVQNLAAEAGA
ncbi:helix-turn-helix domain-containing protein [Azorhizobium doebereinerae]|uniref:helix-turn-helix domain-containing protein n=1 Tax=Azorhizobium doebereinerae TaxID=281091 RepID=UPI00040165EB|nr:helix-turn-helix domain-containing protein [Azorhizobium doebereinerae]